MALVVVGAMAGTSPAMAAKKKAKTSAVSKSWQNQHKDNKVFGNAIHNLRVQSDKTNWDASQFSSFVITAATALQKGLTDLAASYTNFEYGVVQLYAGTTIIPGAMIQTSRLEPTGQQATGSGQFACNVSACSPLTGNKIVAKAAVRSANAEANDKTSNVVCRITASQMTTAAARWVTSAPNAGLNGAPAWPVARSAFPTDKAEQGVMALQPVSTDTLVDLTGTTNSLNQATSSTVPSTEGFATQLSANGNATPAGGNTTNGLVDVTLSCVVAPKA